MSGSSVLVSLTQVDQRQTGFSTAETLHGQGVNICSHFPLSNSISPKKNLVICMCVGGSEKRMEYSRLVKTWKQVRDWGQLAVSHCSVCRLLLNFYFNLMPHSSTPLQLVSSKPESEPPVPWRREEGLFPGSKRWGSGVSEVLCSVSDFQSILVFLVLMFSFDL